jgi:hypothetical protein
MFPHLLKSVGCTQGKRLVIDLQSQLHIETQLLRLDGELWVGCVEDAFVGDFQLQRLSARFRLEVVPCVA